MMKAEVIFELPLDREAATAMVAKARELGHPRLSVILEPGAEANPRTRAAAAFAVGQDVVELSQEIAAISGAGKFIETRLVDA
jgi:hypothetical protein